MAQAAIPLLLIGSLVSAKGAMDEGNAANSMAQSQANQLNANALTTRASAERTAIEDRKQAALLESRAQAVSAASGGGATDPTVLNVVGDIHKQGEYNALNALYNGDVRAQQLNNSADLERQQGRQAKAAGRMKAVGTVLSTGSSMYTRYA